LGVLDRLRNRTGVNNDGVLEAYGNTFVAANSSTASETELRKELEINIHMIEDEGLIKKLDALCVIKFNVPVYNADGSVVLDADKQPVFEEKSYVRQWALALRVYASKVLATRYLDPYDAETAKFRLRRNFLKVKRDMNIKERETFGNFIDAVREYCESAIDDSKNGRKPMLLKVNQKRLEVGLNRGAQKNSGGQ
jgi:hypothetical protein